MVLHFDTSTLCIGKKEKKGKKTLLIQNHCISEVTMYCCLLLWIFSTAYVIKNKSLGCVMVQPQPETKHHTVTHLPLTQWDGGQNQGTKR